jgi:hypothetical protein
MFNYKAFIGKLVFIICKHQDCSGVLIDVGSKYIFVESNGVINKIRHRDVYAVNTMQKYIDDCRELCGSCVCVLTDKGEVYGKLVGFSYDNNSFELNLEDVNSEEQNFIFIKKFHNIFGICRLDIPLSRDFKPDVCYE